LGRSSGYTKVCPTHAIVLPDDQHPVAVVLYLVDPIRPIRDLLAGGRQAELVRHTHEANIILSRRFTSQEQVARPRALDSLWSSMSPCSRPAPAPASATNTILGVLTGRHLETTMLAPAVRRLPAGAAPPALTCLPPSHRGAGAAVRYGAPRWLGGGQISTSRWQEQAICRRRWQYAPLRRRGPRHRSTGRCDIGMVGGEAP
jgi:hypothetical protein